MCGRFALAMTPEQAREMFGFTDLPNFPPRYNIAPTQPVAVVLAEQGARRFRLMRWAFMPSWVKDPKEFPLVFNIRSESAAEKPSFRNALARRRVLMPADAFYEWRRLGRTSEPFLIRRRDRKAFGFAALWETWSGPEGSEVDTVAILTTNANAATAPIHPRSPVIIDEADFEQWLDPDELTAPRARKLLRPPPDDMLEIVRIGDAINKVANDGPEVQAPLDSRAVATPSREARPARPKQPPAPDDGQGSLF